RRLRPANIGGVTLSLVLVGAVALLLVGAGVDGALALNTSQSRLRQLPRHVVLGLGAALFVALIALTVAVSSGFQGPG
ncbi:MAG: hypothetical protein QOI86_1611, partial [Actinomycetota bacterium]|nr:hypothetical protein [Actinomycetota bacterium]